jgi:Na+/H+-dicarboxylate symporter
MVYMCALYLIAVRLGRVSFARFARAIAPAQIVGFSSRSSLAALPAMIEAGETRLALPPAITGFLLPLAVSTFKLGATIAITTSSLFLARIYGVPISPSQVASIAISAVLLSFSVPGIPGGVLLIMVPVLTGVGIPAEGIGILLAVDVVPDMFRTLTNVTADMVAALITARAMNGRYATALRDANTITPLSENA